MICNPLKKCNDLNNNDDNNIQQRWLPPRDQGLQPHADRLRLYASRSVHHHGVVQVVLSGAWRDSPSGSTTVVGGTTNVY